MTSEERFEFHAWAMGWIHRLIADEQQSEHRHADPDQGDYYSTFTIGVEHTSDGVLGVITTPKARGTIMLEAR